LLLALLPFRAQDACLLALPRLALPVKGSTALVVAPDAEGFPQPPVLLRLGRCCLVRVRGTAAAPRAAAAAGALRGAPLALRELGPCLCQATLDVLLLIALRLHVVAHAHKRHFDLALACVLQDLRVGHAALGLRLCGLRILLLTPAHIFQLQRAQVALHVAGRAGAADRGQTYAVVHVGK
jgi:hypothetical protein